MQNFIIGCGYVGTRLAALLPGEVAALARLSESAARLAAAGIDVVQGDLDQPETLLAAATRSSTRTLYYLAPPTPSGRDDLRLAALLDAIDQGSEGPPQRVVMISTTGVYGDCGGDWVRESRPPQPGSDRAWRRLAAEQRLTRWAEAGEVGVVILRVPGIYGPGRLPVERLRRGEPVLQEAISPWSNRIHVDDLLACCVAAGQISLDTARLERGVALVHVADGHPSTMTDYFNQVADLLRLPRPPQLSLEEARDSLSAGMLSYLAESRRLDVTRMREILDVTPRYPTLAEGLPYCV